MWWMAAAAAAKGLMDYGQASKEAKAAKALQRYNNAMISMSTGVNLNAITTNQILNRDASVYEGNQIKVGSILSQAQTEISAAAAGVKGRSVNQALFSVQRNAEIAESNRQVQYMNANLAFDADRLNTSLSADKQTDRSWIPKPNFVGALLGTAAKSYTAYNQK